MQGRHYRLGISLAVLVIWIVITLGGGALVTGGQGSLDDLVTQRVGLQFVVAVLVLVGVVLYVRWQREVALKPAEPPGSWRLLWLPALLIAVFLLFAVLFGLPPISVIMFVLINTLLVGISEELMFRGIVFQGLLSRITIWPAIIITSALFGAVHAFNGFITGDFGAAFNQALAASLSGIWLLAVRLRTRSLYPAIVIHWLWDFAVFLFGLAVASQGAAPGGLAPSPIQRLFGSIAFVIPLVIYGLWLLRNVGKQTKDEVLA